jgi:hypothetical protein
MTPETFDELMIDTRMILRVSQGYAANLNSYHKKWMALDTLESELDPGQKSELETLMRQIAEVGETI